MEIYSSIMSITSYTHSCLLSNLVNFSLIARKDLRDIFDQLSVTRKSKITLNSDKSRSAPELFHEKPEKRKIGKKSFSTLHWGVLGLNIFDFKKPN
jgi:hypothetical protein